MTGNAKRGPLRPPDSPHLGTIYRDWQDFTDRVCRPWVEVDGEDPKVDNWHRVLMLEADPYYLAVSLVIALNHVRRLEDELRTGNAAVEHALRWTHEQLREDRR